MTDPKWKAFADMDLEQFDRVLQMSLGDMRKLLVSKRDSYGPDNLTDFGDIGVLIRTWDKLKRLKHMHEQGLDVTAVGEDAEDAWRDVVGYGLLMLVAIRMQEAEVRDGS